MKGKPGAGTGLSLAGAARIDDQAEAVGVGTKSGVSVEV